MTQDEHTFQENQKDEVAITADEFISTSQEATRQIEKQNDVANTTGSLEPDKSKATREDENKPVNSKAKSNQTHSSRANDGRNSESKTKSTDTGDTHILPWYHVRVPMEKSHIITDEIIRRKKLGEKYFTITFSFPNPYPEFIGVDQDD
jgi:hypothetical protein